jgi:hypothetical protein
MCLGEINSFFSTKIKSNMLVDISHTDDRLNINVDVTFPHMPCDIISLDVQDVMGTHTSNVMGDLKKKKITMAGQFISEESALGKVNSRMDLMNEIKAELEAKQGCQLVGFF